ncbi:MAG: geranylgeranyl reductase [Bacteroidetes bacterium B1(2017)]|nr:MAG: geranylgeranyl reductase [Bacteroidetes bacterium B1(2017)]
MSKPHPSIVIVGAGPAGCATSLFLSKAKIKHTIIEKAVYPRDKVCGDALSGKVVYVLKQLDESILHSFTANPNQFMPSWGLKFVAPNGKTLEIPFKSDPTKEQYAPGFISKRKDFDYALFQKLDPNYATILQGTALKEIEAHSSGVNLFCEQELDGKKVELNFTNVDLVIGAEGDRSIVGKKLGGMKKENLHYCAGIRAYYKGIKDLHPENYIELHFLEELLPGYFWIFPLPNGMANVGAGMLSQTASKKKINLKADMLRAIQNNPKIKDRFIDAELDGKIEGWGLPLGSKKRPISGNNFLLTGDAGGLIDPFTGEGIGNALYSGMLAAKHIEEAIAQNRFDANFNLAYDTAFYKRQWDELKLSHTLQKLCKYPWLFNFMVNKANKNKTLRETITCMFEDLDMRAKLRNPLFYLKLLMND